MKKRTLTKFFGLAMIVTTISCSSAESEKSTTEIKTDSTQMMMPSAPDSMQTRGVVTGKIDTSKRPVTPIIPPPPESN